VKAATRQGKAGKARQSKMVLSSKAEKLLDDITKAVVADGAITPVGIACLTLFTANLAYRVSKTFQRDASGNTFGDFFTGSFNLLSNKDSVLKRSEVKDSINGYEDLFSGARKDVGKINTEDSIKKREKEYKTMVNSFYNLVTDFYEWGWGQVRAVFE
jgi:hypothetical protein